MDGIYIDGYITKHNTASSILKIGVVRYLYTVKRYYCD